MPEERDLTVGQAAASLGVTVRALHHWDEIGLAEPSLRSASGYRLYSAEDLERLRRVVVYRELGLDLDAIAQVLDDPDTDVSEALRSQRAQLSDRIAHLESLGEDLDRMIAAQERGILLTRQEQEATLGPGWDPGWPTEARRRWGDSTQWQQYAERAASRRPEEWRALADATRALDRRLGDAMAAGVEPGDPQADALAEEHRQAYSAFFPLSREMQVLLGRMYEADPQFTAHYDAVRPGLAGWLRRIIDASARAAGIDPDAAVWR